MATKSFDIYSHVTNTIVTAIEAGQTEFTLPWQRSGIGEILPVNAATNSAYNGINIISLWATAMDRGYERGLWATYRQWAELGAQVRKGERGSCVIFYKQYELEPDQGTPMTTASVAWPVPRSCSTPRRSTASNCPVFRIYHRSSGLRARMR